MRLIPLNCDYIQKPSETLWIQDQTRLASRQTFTHPSRDCLATNTVLTSVEFVVNRNTCVIEFQGARKLNFTCSTLCI